jgi:methionyl-tRNA formyltransferase
MGTAGFGIPTLERLLVSSHAVCCVVTSPSKPKGRGLKYQEAPVARYAREKKISPVLTPADCRDRSFIERLKTFDADLFVVVAFRILPPEVFTIPRGGTINIHASLLPKYRGPAPIQRAIQAGETRTGITIFKIDEGIDTGASILRKRVDIDKYETAQHLHDRLSQLGAVATLEAIDILARGQIELIPQNNEGVSYAPKLKKEEGRIRWEMSATDIFNCIRAFTPFPGTYTFFNGKRLNLLWALPSECRVEAEPGTIVSVEKDAFSVRCGEGCLKVLSVKMEGKREMACGDFLRGVRIECGMVL